MNSAAVIGRQLRQHQTTAARGGQLAPPSPPHKGRPRTPSHQPHPPPTPPAPSNAAAAAAEANKPKGLDKMKSCVSCRCIWLCCKALSGGVLLIAIGVGMTVFGFYADHLAVQETFDAATNATSRVVDETIKAHLLNLTYVGPVFMGLGGMMIVAACVLFDGMDLHPPPTEGTEQLLEPPPKAARCNGPFLSLDLPPARARDKGGGGATIEEEDEDDDDDFEEVVTVAAVEPPPPPPAAPRASFAPLALAAPPQVAVRQPRRKPSFLSPLFDVLPSPLDIQIADPDGCTPGDAGALELRLFAPPPRLRMEPHVLASVESDGLSDEDSDATTATPARRGWCDADAPLLGRCSPPSSPEYPLEPLLKRERAGLRRFQLMRQVPRTLFDGPASEGGSR